MTFTSSNVSRRQRLKQGLGSVAASVLAMVIVAIAVVMFLVKIGVEVAFLGSLWHFVTGEWRIGLTLLGIAVAVSWLVLS